MYSSAGLIVQDALLVGSFGMSLITFQVFPAVLAFLL